MKLMPLGACPICDALWREFAYATAQHVRLLMESQDAAMKHDTVLAATTETLITEAEARRAAARNAVHGHEAIVHKTADSATS
jgi:hypothetical protein